MHDKSLRTIGPYTQLVVKQTREVLVHQGSHAWWDLLDNGFFYTIGPETQFVFIDDGSLYRANTSAGSIFIYEALYTQSLRIHGNLRHVWSRITTSENAKQDRKSTYLAFYGRLQWLATAYHTLHRHHPPDSELCRMHPLPRSSSSVQTDLTQDDSMPKNRKRSKNRWNDENAVTVIH